MAPQPNEIKQYEQGVKTGVILVYYNTHVPQQRGFSSTLAVSAKYQHLAQFSGDRIWMKIRIVGPLVAIQYKRTRSLFSRANLDFCTTIDQAAKPSSLNLGSHRYAKAKGKRWEKTLLFELKRLEKRSRYDGLTSCSSHIPTGPALTYSTM